MFILIFDLVPRECKLGKLTYQKRYQNDYEIESDQTM
jgi:hypothetical protein